MHTIRLREPWEVETAPDYVVYRRYFNCPTGLEPGTVVRLAIEELPPAGQVSINTAPLRPAQSVWDISAALQPRNLISIELRGSPVSERPFGEVRLEIQEPSRT